MAARSSSSSSRVVVAKAAERGTRCAGWSDDECVGGLDELAVPPAAGWGCREIHCCCSWHWTATVDALLPSWPWAGSILSLAHIILPVRSYLTPPYNLPHLLSPEARCSSLHARFCSHDSSRAATWRALRLLLPQAPCCRPCLPWGSGRQQVAVGRVALLLARAVQRCWRWAARTGRPPWRASSGWLGHNLVVRAR